MAGSEPRTDASDTPPEGFFELWSKFVSANAADAAYRLAPGEFLFEVCYNSCSRLVFADAKQGSSKHLKIC